MRQTHLTIYHAKNKQIQSNRPLGSFNFPKIQRKKCAISARRWRFEDELFNFAPRTIFIPMKDSVVRGRVLQLLHERRGEGFLPFGAAERGVPAPEGINNRDWLRALAQLAEY